MKFCSRYAYPDVCATKNHEFLESSSWSNRSHPVRTTGIVFLEQQESSSWSSRSRLLGTAGVVPLEKHRSSSQNNRNLNHGKKVGVGLRCLPRNKIDMLIYMGSYVGIEGSYIGVWGTCRAILGTCIAILGTCITILGTCITIWGLV